MRTLSTLLLMLFSHTLFAETRHADVDTNIIITGYIPDNLVSEVDDKACIYFYNNFNEKLYSDVEEVFPIRLTDNQFKITITPKNKTAYLALKGLYVKSLFWDICLLQAGDSVSLHMSQNKEVYFTGRGAAKINYQLWLGTQWNLNRKTFNDINDPQRIAYYKRERFRILSTAMDSLYFYRSIWDPEIHHLLRINTISRVNNFYLARISNQMTENNSAYRQLLKEEISHMLMQNSFFVLTDQLIVDHAFLYKEYLYNLNKTYARLVSGETWPFEMVYRSIKERYSGSLSDKLIAICFLNMIQRDERVMRLLTEALELVKDKEAKEILQRAASAGSPGVKAYNFDLEGVNGERIRLQDFRGKVVVLDTWFNGCLGCISLKRQMDPIIRKYRNSRDVVFIGVNVDKSKEKFIDGINSGLYTAKETINAYTNGLGTLHPMLLHYQYRGYPNLLLIDKEGLVISANPPRPIDVESRRRLIALIEEHR